ncbi:HET domain-containing protein [Colletotrichum simmondsii]|uniref:HET domain-containing protein n=1 Tax=Colletotrichum simmondsii TaxID=703756 RepID=A0A135S823_9PEZI|nr:HET domain-containing protein [Colletotrichum simmondsii]
MKLIHTQSYQLSEVADFNIPPFAVLSYAPAALFPCDSQQVLSQRTATHFNNTVLQACQKADARGLQFLWFGSVCVDKTSSLGLQHAVSYSFRLLQAATVCFVYLQDLLPSSASLEESWGGCRYWKRSWTLQELIAPSNVEFFDADWNFLGIKSSPGLLDILQTVTRIDKSILTDRDALSRVAIGVRLSWAAGREATRAEDAAYSLVGITGVNMSIRYGEGLEQAFARLVEKIIGVNMDGSIFAWTSHDDQFVRGLLPQSISEFRHLSNTADFPLLQQPWTFDGNVTLNSNGLLLDSHASLQDSSLILEIGQASETRLGIRIQIWERRFVRVNSRDLVRGFRSPKPCRILAARNIDAKTSQSISNSSKKRKRSSRLDTDPSEYSAVLLSSSSTNPPYVLDDDSCSSCSYNKDTLHLKGVGVEDEEVDSDYDDMGESESQVDIRERTSLSPNHPYQYERDALLRHFNQRVRSWAHSATYTAPPESQLSRKRLKIEDSGPCSVSEESDFEDFDDAPHGFSIVSNVDGYFHFACPFYATNPAGHEQCLIEDDLLSTEDVVQHIRKRHSKPPYCPKCRIVLETPMARDEHVRRNICELRHPTTIEGVDEDQLRKIMKVMARQPRRSSEAQIWARICAVACPGAFYCISPYLQDGLGLEVSKVRDYWNDKGRRCIKKYMAGRGVLCTEDEYGNGALEAFHALTMADLVHETVAFCGHKSE